MHTQTSVSCDRTVSDGGSLWAGSQRSLSSFLPLTLTQTPRLSAFVSLYISISLPPPSLSPHLISAECEDERRLAKATHTSQHLAQLRIHTPHTQRTLQLNVK